MKQVVVLGCGAWSTAIAKVIADNVASSNEFCSKIAMYVRGETHNDRNLVDYINNDHINPVYLPCITIPTNVVANIAYPSRYVQWLIKQMNGHVKENAYFVSFCKGLVLYSEENRVKLVSDMIREQTGKSCVVVSGATTAIEIAEQQFTEVTIGAKNYDHGSEVKRLLQTNYLRMVITQDDVGVELCGGIKHVVAIAAGICDGLKLGDNTKSAVLRIGFWEMSELMKELFPDRGTDWLTIEQSCGMAELFICMSHRSDEVPDFGSDLDLINITVGRRLSHPGSSFSLHQLTKDSKRVYTDGVDYAKQIYKILTARHRTGHFPLFIGVHRICQNELKPQDLLSCLSSHPIHS
ncbi:glycerol-3-phosphate dehydrogenase, variant 4 [Schistosoma haematobium]|uniref:Glycerol-3-phosphate dehydrogenase [NAD(+)] n=1 Tax=Schistosoma haematobium TaxID=6185 RepID=A0A922LMN9_SCHHA|nr:glycerol-3-phosphate dehydrogenase, variant 4 [Schistosoma haematobium]KAH9589903.1 glycerol-3-phosphate dehydrogenase, variant 4 [Schistosoma haematobium]